MNRGTLTLIGPTDPFIRNQRSEGILFTVEGSSVGLERTAVDQEKVFGAIPQLQPGAVTAPTAGVVANEAAGTVFRSHLTGSNATYIDESATGLTRGAATDVINATSLGSDPIIPAAQLFFSVDNVSVGLTGTAVAGQASKKQQGADIFMVPLGQATPSSSTTMSNKLHIN